MSVALDLPASDAESRGAAKSPRNVGGRSGRRNRSGSPLQLRGRVAQPDTNRNQGGSPHDPAQRNRAAKNLSWIANPSCANSGMLFTKAISEKFRLQRSTRSPLEKPKLIIPLRLPERTVIPRQVNVNLRPRCSHNVLHLAKIVASSRLGRSAARTDLAGGRWVTIVPTRTPSSMKRRDPDLSCRDLHSPDGFQQCDFRPFSSLEYHSLLNVDQALVTRTVHDETRRKRYRFSGFRNCSCVKRKTVD